MVGLLELISIVWYSFVLNLWPESHNRRRTHRTQIPEEEPQTLLFILWEQWLCNQRAFTVTVDTYWMLRLYYFTSQLNSISQKRRRAFVRRRGPYKMDLATCNVYIEIRDQSDFMGFVLRECKELSTHAPAEVGGFWHCSCLALSLLTCCRCYVTVIVMLLSLLICCRCCVAAVALPSRKSSAS